MLYTLMFAAVIFTAVAYFTKRATVGIGAAMFWAVTAFYSYSLHTAMFDIYWVLTWVSVALMFAVFLESAFMKFGVTGSSTIPQDKEPQDKPEIEETLKERRDRLGLPPIERRRRSEDF